MSVTSGVFSSCTLKGKVNEEQDTLVLFLISSGGPFCPRGCKQLVHTFLVHSIQMLEGYSTYFWLGYAAKNVVCMDL